MARKAAVKTTVETTSKPAVKWAHPYTPAEQYKKKVAYFCMEFAIDQHFKIYSGGLGFLAGSHMRSAYDLKQNLIGIGILWKFGYYDQVRNPDNTMGVLFKEKSYSYLQDTGIKLTVQVHQNPNVWVKVYYLAPEVFGTVPMYFLSTDVPENDYLARTITERLYDNNVQTRVAQSIVLGIGGGKLVDILGGADIYHINEGHALPLAFYLLNEKFNNNIKELKKHFVFTTHTPELAGNEEHDAHFLNEMCFFGKFLSKEEILKFTYNEPRLNYTLTALRFSKIANGVSQLHGKVAQEMWKPYPDICKIIAITNAQDQKFWEDKAFARACESGDKEAIIERKHEMKKDLFYVVADQTGKIFHSEILTIVWARRFASYKRADLLLKDLERFEKLVKNLKYPIQIIWAGKPYPLDQSAIKIFNKLVEFTKNYPNLAILTGYEMTLSRLLKCGADVWLNTPRRPREASGTSGMTAAMNGAVNVSILDGWICEFAKHGVNSFVAPIVDETLPIEEIDKQDCNNIYNLLEKEVIPTYYDNPDKWIEIVKQSRKDVLAYFTSTRMADEYYKLLYNAPAPRK
ncbi:MAG: alpha-glucan family phosphorylase [Microscillaceae bacterium]|nr:alpha-glucan family phosphorylase [Microscillaceae bacterium]MDW8459731.1 alpha-glucan family phosphorylase [Cytophagales bacterium]